MTFPGWSWAAVALGLILGLLAVFTGSGVEAWLGAVVVLLSAGLGISELRRSRARKPEPLPGRIPGLSLLESLLPPVFLLVTGLVILAALVYTLLQTGVF